VKTLHLIRHAKSSWNHPGLSDAERPLNERGEKACRAMARPIMEAGCSFEHVFCSMAKRTRMTIEGIAETLPHPGIKWQVEEQLYTFSSQALLGWIHQLDDALDEVVTIGHNPATTDFCNAMGDRFIPNVPTCGYVQLRFELDSWRTLAPGSGRTLAFLGPKLLRQQPGD
jgi:phosphohistidine phosphatase